MEEIPMTSARWLCVATFAAACSGKGGDSSGGEDTSVDTFSVSGTVVDMNVPPLGTAVTKSCTVAALDPTPALGGGQPSVIATGTIAGDGTYSITGIDSKPKLGILLNVNGCPNAGDIPTSTGLAVEDYQDLADGGEITNHTIYRIPADLGAAIDEDLAKSGYKGKGLLADGALLSFVLVGTEPADGATLECTGCDASFYYFDNARPNSGYFATDKTLNASTSAMTGGMAIVPGAPIYTYTADDGSHTFESRTLGSQPGSVLITRFTGT
jgi:hypothetical protein